MVFHSPILLNTRASFLAGQFVHPRTTNRETVPCRSPQGGAREPRHTAAFLSVCWKPGLGSSGNCTSCIPLPSVSACLLAWPKHAYKTKTSAPLPGPGPASVVICITYVMRWVEKSTQPVSWGICFLIPHFRHCSSHKGPDALLRSAL